MLRIIDHKVCSKIGNTLTGYELPYLNFHLKVFWVQLLSRLVLARGYLPQLINKHHPYWQLTANYQSLSSDPLSVLHF